MKILLSLMVLLCPNFLCFAASAVYYSPSASSYYVQINEKSAQIAKDKAGITCMKDTHPDCRMAISTEYSGYGAIAKNKDLKGATYGWNTTSSTKAKQNALEECNEKYGNCKITLSWHDKVDGTIPKQEEENDRYLKICGTNWTTGVLYYCGSGADMGGTPLGQPLRR